jgi:Protein of unknown function (DUF3887)
VSAASGHLAGPVTLTALAARLTERAGQLADAGARDDATLNAVWLASELREVSGVALRLAVGRARAAGHTWQDVGDLLGITRQAAFQRFGRPIDLRTGEHMTRAALPDAGERATEVLIDWMGTRYGDVVAELDAAMTSKLSADELASAWAQVIGVAGEYQGMGEPQVQQKGDYTVVDVPLSFKNGLMTGRVVYDSEGRVSGLFVVMPDAE